MSDLLQVGSEWLGGVLDAHASQPIVYSRGSESATVTATIGSMEFASSDSSGLVTTWKTTDFILLATQLAAFTTVYPQRGDLIGWNDETYVVIEPSGLPCFETVDGGVTFRVHTKRRE